MNNLAKKKILPPSQQNCAADWQFILFLWDVRSWSMLSGILISWVQINKILYNFELLTCCQLRARKPFKCPKSHSTDPGFADDQGCWLIAANLLFNYHRTTSYCWSTWQRPSSLVYLCKIVFLSGEGLSEHVLLSSFLIFIEYLNELCRPSYYLFYVTDLI